METKLEGPKIDKHGMIFNPSSFKPSFVKIFLDEAEVQPGHLNIVADSQRWTGGEGIVFHNVFNDKIIYELTV